MPYIGKQPANVPVTADDIPANSIDASKIIDGAITIADIADDAVTADKLANSINSAIAANTAKTGITSGQASAITANTAKVTNSTDASDLTSGTLPMARLSGTLPALNGASLTSVNAVNGGRKNIVMNGAFQVWQRGTSFTADGDVFGADRWVISRPNQTVTKEIASIGNIRCNSMKMLKTGSGAITAYHSIEDGTGVSAGGSLFNGKTLTLSYYARASGSFDNNGQVWLYYNNNSSSVQVATCTDSLSTSWTKFTHTFTMPTNTETYANVYSLTLSLIRALDGNVGNSDWVEVAQVQLEESSTATDFEHRSYGEELALCQRYYEIVKNIRVWTWNAANGARLSGSFRTEKRAAPTVSGAPINIDNAMMGSTQTSFAGPSTTTLGFAGYCYNFASLTTYRSWYSNTSLLFDAEL